MEQNRGISEFSKKKKSVDRSYFKLPNGCVEQSARDQRANERLLNGEIGARLISNKFSYGSINVRAYNACVAARVG